MLYHKNRLSQNWSIFVKNLKDMIAEAKKQIYTHSDLDSSLHRIAQKVLNEERITVDEGIQLFEKGTLGFLGSLADFIRTKKHGDYTYFNRNFHIEPTNICVFDCKFCSYSRLLKHRQEGWELNADDILNRSSYRWRSSS